jgi:hypothetical protein
MLLLPEFWPRRRSSSFTRSRTTATSSTSAHTNSRTGSPPADAIASTSSRACTKGLPCTEQESCSSPRHPVSAYSAGARHWSVYVKPSDGSEHADGKF